MKKSFLVWLALGLLTSLVLAACGDSTATSTAQTAAGGTTVAATTAGPMPGHAMGAATTAALTTAAATTPPAAATQPVTSLPSTTAPASSATTATTAAVPVTTATGMNNGSGHMAMAGDDPMTNSLKGLSGQEFEVNFLQQMIVHHQSAVDMAKMAATNTRRPELLKLSQNIITAQTGEISQMSGWLFAWYNAKPVSDAMKVPGMMEMMGDMDKLKTTRDARFDEMFLQMMIAHHQQAVNMAHLLQGKTQRPELVKLGQAIVKDQTAEIEQMKGWQKDWNLKA